VEKHRSNPRYLKKKITKQKFKPGQYLKGKINKNNFGKK
jgi:hypothetical protein